MAETVLISGGSRGLGLALAASCLAEGHRVATFSRSLTPALSSLAAQHPERLLSRALDATDKPSVRAFVALVRERLGVPTTLVNNAAVGQDHLLAQLPEARLAELLAVNLEAPIFLTRLVVREMLRTAQPGRIINISSICGSRGFPGLTVYSATKGALDAFTRSLAHELGPRGILVNSLAPGFFSSEMSAVLPAEGVETIRRRAASERLTEIHHVVTAFHFLLSADCNLTGQVLHVDGGY